MGQMIFIDEDELKKLKMRAEWGETYKRELKYMQKKLYPDYISVDPVNDYCYHLEILLNMYLELKNKRKKWWKGGR